MTKNNTSDKLKLCYLNLESSPCLSRDFNSTRIPFCVDTSYLLP